MINQGHVGEAKVFADLVAQGYYVFYTPLEGCVVDFVISKDGLTNFKRVQVKSCKHTQIAKKSGNRYYKVKLASGIKCYNLKGIPTRKTIFDKTKFDIVAIYLVDIDKCIYLDSSKIENEFALTINQNKLQNGFYCGTLEELLRKIN